MKIIRYLIIVMLFFYAGCISENKKHSTLKKSFEKTKDTTSNASNIFSEPRLTYFYDSLLTAKVDTSTLKGKRKFIMNHFLIENAPSSSDYDTLFDLNYDGYKDYIIGYYGAAGTGYKNRVIVYLYSPVKKNYIQDENLSGLPNPSFYINRRKITSFYMAAGAGYGVELNWIDNKWIEVMSFDVENNPKNNDSAFFTIKYPLKKKRQNYYSTYFYIPPSSFLENKWESILPN